MSKKKPGRPKGSPTINRTPAEPFPAGSQARAIVVLEITGATNRQTLELLNAAAKGEPSALKLLGMALKYTAWMIDLKSCKPCDNPAENSQNNSV